jgi:hypothetical protein
MPAATTETVRARSDGRVESPRWGPGDSDGSRPSSQFSPLVAGARASVRRMARPGPMAAARRTETAREIARGRAAGQDRASSRGRTPAPSRAGPPRARRRRRCAALRAWASVSRPDPNARRSVNARTAPPCRVSAPRIARHPRSAASRPAPRVRTCWLEPSRPASRPAPRARRSCAPRARSALPV